MYFLKKYQRKSSHQQGEEESDLMYIPITRFWWPDDGEEKAWEEIIKCPIHPYFKGEARNQRSCNRAVGSADTSFSSFSYLCALWFYAAERRTSPEHRQRWQQLPSAHWSSNNAFIWDKSCCTTPACLTRCSCHKHCEGNWTNPRHLLPCSIPSIYPPGAVKLLSWAGWSHHTSTPSTGQMWKTIWNFGSSSPKSVPCTAWTVLPPSFPSPPRLPLFSTAGCSGQSSKMKQKTDWVSSPCTLQRATRTSFVRNSVFQPKKAIKVLLCQRLHQESFENSYF